MPSPELRPVVRERLLEVRPEPPSELAEGGAGVCVSSSMHQPTVPAPSDGITLKLYLPPGGPGSAPLNGAEGSSCSTATAPAVPPAASTAATAIR